MVIIAFNSLMCHLELILTTDQGNCHEYVQIYGFPVTFLYFFCICFIMSQKGNRQKIRYNAKDNNEK